MTLLKGFIIWNETEYKGGFGCDGAIYSGEDLAEAALNKMINVAWSEEYFKDWQILPFKFDLSQLPKLVDKDNLPIFTYYLEDK